MKSQDARRLAVVHVAKKQTGMTEDEYRCLLSSVGAESAKDLSPRQFAAVMTRFEALGFQTTSTRRRTVRGLPERSKAKSLKKIEAILLDMGLSWAYADSIARSRFDVDACQWLAPDQARKLMQMLVIHQKRTKDI